MRVEDTGNVQAPFSVNASHVYSMDLLSQYERSGDKVTCGARVYLTKEDGRYLDSPNHPDLTNEGPPRTLTSSQTLVNSTHMRETGSDQENSDGDSAEEDTSRRPDKKLRRSRLSILEEIGNRCWQRY